MSTDLTKAFKKRKPKVKRKQKKVGEGRAIISNWPKENIYDVFIKLQPEDLSVNLENYQQTLDPHSNIGEIRAINLLTQKVPWTRVPLFFKYMKDSGQQKLAPALESFMRRISGDIEKAAKVVSKRKIRNPGGYVSFPHGFKRKGRKWNIKTSTDCFTDYKYAPWVPNAKEIVMRRKVLLPGNPTVTNARWFTQEVRDGWYKIDDYWFELVCRFGRPWRHDTVGYLLENGEIIPESKELYRAAQSYFSGDFRSVKDYMTAPWAKGFHTHGVYTIVAKETPMTRKYLRKKINDAGWYTLTKEWYKKACKNGRPYTPGVFGYLLKNGKVFPETKNTYILSRAYSTTCSRKYFTRPELRSLCLNNILTPIWLKPLIGEAPIGMVALNTPETKKWIVPNPITGTSWYNLKLRWYKHVCETGHRDWQPGLFGYRTVSGRIIPETKEMYQTFMLQLEQKNNFVHRPGPFINNRIQGILAEVIPSDILDSLMKEIPADNFLETVATIYTYASPLIDKPQVHRVRLARHQYPIEMIPFMTKEEMLPEVFKNPLLNPVTVGGGSLSWDDFESRIENRIKFAKLRMIQGSYYKAGIDRVVTRYEMPIPLKAVVNRCSPDPVYYMEDDTMYCFDRSTIKGVKENPETGKEFSEEFITFVSRLKNPVVPDTDDIGGQGDEQIGVYRDYHTKNKVSRVVLSLVKSVNKDIYSSVDNTHCAQCRKYISDPKYKSVFKGDVVKFCNTKCFDDFPFK